MHANKTLEFKQQHGDATQITAHVQKSYTKTGCEHVDFCFNMRVCQD